MKFSASFPRPLFFLTVSSLFLGMLLTTNCGSSSSNAVKAQGNTAVSVFLSGTANAELAEYDIQLQSITLTNQAGTSVTLLSAPQPSEFIHLNGQIEPLVTVTVPQDTYTAANVTLATPEFINTQYEPTQNALAICENGSGNPTITVNLPSPITVTGDNMGLVLNLQVSQSTGPFSCSPYTGATPSPTFNLTPLAISAQATNPANGKVIGMEASVASIASSGASLTLSVTAGPFGNRTLSASTNDSTVFQGIGNASALAAGMFVNLDGTVQSDGSLLASRIEVENPSAINIWTGPLLQVDSIVPVLLMYGRQEQGPLFTGPNGNSGVYMDIPFFDFSAATFGTSGQISNLQTLPFVPTFNDTNLVAGQTVDITSPDFVFGGGLYTPANTITLIPQTVNGTVESTSTSGNFTIYTVLLAPYDQFPNLAQQSYQVSTITNPSEVEVYVDSNTQKLNTQTLATGNTFRFYGLVFNDSGTLRMDCVQLIDGVAFAPTSGARSQLAKGATRTVRRVGPTDLPPVIITSTQSQ